MCAGTYGPWILLRTGRIVAYSSSSVARPLPTSILSDPLAPRLRGGDPVSRGRLGARLLVAGRARLRRARSRDAGPGELPRPLPEWEALLREADPLLLGDVSYIGARRRQD